MRSRILSLVICFIFAALASGCGNLHQLPPYGPSNGPYISKNNEFSVNIPEANVTVQPNSQQNFLSVDFSLNNPFEQAITYSVEWTVLPEKTVQTEQEFYKSWEDFLPKYLAGNFGSGRYSLLHKEQGRHNKYPTLQFVAVGTHNGGGSGSIYGTAIGFGNRVAVVYVIRGNQPEKFTSFESLPGFETYEKFSQSLKCLRACN